MADLKSWPNGVPTPAHGRRPTAISVPWVGKSGSAPRFATMVYRAAGRRDAGTTTSSTRRGRPAAETTGAGPAIAQRQRQNRHGAVDAR